MPKQKNQQPSIHSFLSLSQYLRNRNTAGLFQSQMSSPAKTPDLSNSFEGCVYFQKESTQFSSSLIMCSLENMQTLQENIKLKSPVSSIILIRQLRYLFTF